MYKFSSNKEPVNESPSRQSRVPDSVRTRVGPGSERDMANFQGLIVGFAHLPKILRTYIAGHMSNRE